MAGAEGVVRAFAAVEKTGGAAGLAELAEKLAAAAGEEFVHVALVGDVEDKLVGRRIEDAVQRDRELDDAEIGADVAAVAGRDGDEFLADFLGELRQLVGAEGFDVGGAADAGEETVGDGRRGR